MDISTSPVPTSPWRAESISNVDGGTLIQTGRVDVLIHLLAFEQLAGAKAPGVILSARGEGVDWVAISDELAATDHEPSVATLASELLTSPFPEIRVTFGSGGQILRGATMAAAALYSGYTAQRVEGTDAVQDRSLAAFADGGWSASMQRELLLAWTTRDPQAGVFMIDLDAPGADDAEHELTCRYDVLHGEFDHLSMADSAALNTHVTGSIRLLFVRATPNSLSSVLDRHRDALPLASRGAEAAGVLQALWSEDRTPSSSPSHEQRLRRLRRQAFTSQLLNRALGR